MQLCYAQLVRACSLFQLTAISGESLKGYDQQPLGPQPAIAENVLSQKNRPLTKSAETINLPLAARDITRSYHRKLQSIPIPLSGQSKFRQLTGLFEQRFLFRVETAISDKLVDFGVVPAGFAQRSRTRGISKISKR
jgi:hypothetical protein